MGADGGNRNHTVLRQGHAGCVQRADGSMQGRCGWSEVLGEKVVELVS